MANHSKQLQLGYLSLILATAFWGGNFVLGKVLSGAIEPISLTFSRWFPAFLILALVFYRPTKQSLVQLNAHPLRNFSVMWSLGMLGVVLFPATLYQGLKTTSALNASLYLAVVPVLVLLLNRLLFKEKISPMILAGALISLIGVVWLLSQGDLMRMTQLNVNHGDLWAIASAVSWAIYCCIIRFRPTNISNTAFLTLLVGLAVVSLIPFFLVELFSHSAAQFIELHSAQWLGIGYLIIGPSILSYAFWNYGIAIVGPAKGAVMTNVTPLFAALFSIVLLNEAVQSFHLISASLIVLGVLICSYHKK